MGGLWAFLTDPAVESRLRAGETEIRTVHKHWFAYWRVALETLAVIVLIALYLATDARGSWIFAWLAAFVLVHAVWMFASLYSDVFVITDRRVFRVRGPLRLRFATMPAARIVDYSVNQSVMGWLVGYAHFVFESAGQDLAMHEITYVPHPSDCSDDIQDVVQPVDEDSPESVGTGGQGD